MSQITINGVTYTGNNINISKGKIIIDGNDATPEAKQITIKVDGSINQLRADHCDRIEVTGNVSSVITQSGDVEVNGDISGSITTMSGDVDCNTVHGSVSTMSGNIKHQRI